MSRSSGVEVGTRNPAAHRLALRLDIEGEGHVPTRAHVKRLGRNHGLAPHRIDSIIEEVEKAVSGWQNFAEAAQVEASLAHIAERIASVRAAFG